MNLFPKEKQANGIENKHVYQRETGYGRNKVGVWG